ncbi:hypothetical protein KJ603_01345 [Patescibacteria group bacterium]|nr:hypothetical protein [Patescibacteria group bacterium]
MEIKIGRIASDKKIAQFFLGNITFLGYYNPYTGKIVFETQQESQILDPNNIKISKKDYAELMRKASAILAKRTPR